MTKGLIVVTAEWDEEAQVWFATSEDIGGLAVEAPNEESLRERVLGAIRDLIECNGLPFGAENLPDIPVSIMARHLANVPNPCYT